MANGTELEPGSGGDTICTTDLDNFTGYSTTGKMQGVSLLVGATPAAVSSANPYPVSVIGTAAVSAASLPLPSGASTAANQSTGNSSLASILSALGGTLVVGDGGGSLTVDGTVAVTGTFWQATQPVSAASLPLPSGAATAAKQPALGTAGTASADVLSVQGVASMTALKVDGSAVTQPVSGTFWQATQPVSLAATVTVTGAGGTFPVTDSGGSLTVDAPVGTPVFVRLSDGSSAIATLPVSLASVPSHAVTNAGTFAVQVDNTVTVASHAVTNAGTFAVQVSSALPAGTNHVGGVDIEAFEASASVTMQSAATATGNGTALTVTGYGTAVIQVTGTFVGTVTFEATADGANYHAISATQIGTGTIATTGTTTGIYRLSVSGLTSVRARVSAYTSGGVTAVGRATNAPMATKAVQIAGNVITSNGGTFAVQAAQSGAWNVGTVTTVTTCATVTTVSSVTDASVQGKAAHDAAASGNPVLTGAEANRARITAVTEGDAARVQADRYGRLKVVGGQDLLIAAVQATASGDTSLVAAPGASTRLKLVRVEASNSHATTAVTVGLKSASLNGGSVFGKKYLPAAGGLAVWTFPHGHLMCGANEALNVNLSAGSAQVEVTAYYEQVAD